MKNNVGAQCASCSGPMNEKLCTKEGDKGKNTHGCPTVSKKTLLSAAKKEYTKKGIREFAKNASIQEGQCYANRDRKPYVMHPVKPRIVEICEFAEKMKYKRIGLIFCGGLAKEAEIVSRIFQKKGYDTISVMCKAGGIPKEQLGLTEKDKIYSGQFEAMCNPIFQAMVANDAHTELNVLLGLCVGHDSLFLKYSKAPATILAVKDRVTGHNPLAAIYLSGSYYSWAENE
ncbi:MAG TPA: DUF1847 domain-containing protein [Syntrophorhabdaceae bacterium]|nr:DUF1847 domain-containing protein [Syntrophorhabdaceae bacterium]